MKKILLSVFTFSTFSLIAQNVIIPDANLKANLLNNPLINTNMDSEIQLSEATAYNGAITCPYENITDLTGIEAFTSLTELFCYGNLLTIIDVSSNTALIKLNCKENNYLSSLNVANGNNVNFSFFRASDNPSLTCIQVDDVSYSNDNWTNTSGGSFEFDGGVIFSLNCGSTASLEELKTNVEIFPNPVKSVINISGLAKEKIKSINIYNSTGMVLFRSNLNDQQINVEFLPAGVYFIGVLTEDQESILKIIKE